MYFLAAVLAVTLAWQDNSVSEDGFNIYRQLPAAGFVLLSTVPANVVTFRDTATEPGACYKVTAFNLAGESDFSNTVCLPLPPAAPSALRFG
jgi:hypothetical protein